MGYIYQTNESNTRKRILGGGASQVASIIGQYSAMCKSVLLGKLKLMCLHRLLASKQCWVDRIALSQEGIVCLEWWLEAVDNWNCRPIQVEAGQYQVFSEASTTG